MLENHLSIRIPAAEMTILEQYCTKYKRTKTDVVREFIRSLAQKAESRPVFPDGVPPSGGELFKTIE